MAQSLPSVCRIKPSFQVLVVDPNKVIIRTGAWTGQSMVLRDDKGTGMLAAVIQMLDGTHPTEAIFQEVGVEYQESVLDLLSSLQQQGIVEAVPVMAAGNVEVAPASVSAALMFLSAISRQPTEVTEDLLRKANITLIGAGAIGSRAATQLAQSGIGSITIVDPGLVRASDIQYDLTYTGKDDGSPRAQCLAAFIAQRFPHTATHAVTAFSGAAVQDAVAGGTFTLVALDAPDPQVYHQVNQVALTARKPWSIVTLDALNGLIGPTFIPHQTACYACFETRLEANLVHYEPYVLAKNAALVHSGGFIGMPGTADVMAGLATYELLRYVTTGHSFTIGHLLRFDFQTGGLERNEVLKLPRCLACGKAAAGKANPVAYFTLERLVEELGV